jgi:hypothetical protein
MFNRILLLDCRFVQHTDESWNYGDFYTTKYVTLDDYIMPNLLSSGDYAGTIIEAANNRAFLRLYGHLEGVHDVRGGHGTRAVAISIQWLLDNPQVLDTLEALEDYPIIDDEVLSEYELELIREGWETWARHDYLVGLCRRFGDVAMTDDELYELFNRVAERIGVEWEPDGTDMTIDVDKVVKATGVMAWS